jgi:hypothetical protein
MVLNFCSVSEAFCIPSLILTAYGLFNISSLGTLPVFSQIELLFPFFSVNGHILLSEILELLEKRGVTKISEPIIIRL